MVGASLLSVAAPGLAEAVSFLRAHPRGAGSRGRMAAPEVIRNRVSPLRPSRRDVFAIRGGKYGRRGCALLSSRSWSGRLLQLLLRLSRASFVLAARCADRLSVNLDQWADGPEGASSLAWAGGSGARAVTFDRSLHEAQQLRCVQPERLPLISARAPHAGSLHLDRASMR